ncbi:hypothetical protein QR680_009405 [Steinernema hermaphroditum]|uniref:ZP domain-containing protein n=1 Tax=Steinernema hermaphroditum TaxID=289476 RepID=A0AA39IM66_9BILA|nr:hypothetical protein QR680_009405 [Steinernema hermaphroditum]
MPPRGHAPDNRQRRFTCDISVFSFDSGCGDVPQSLSRALLMWPPLLGQMLSLALLLVLLPASRVAGISIDNDIVGEPDIECLENEIRVWVKTRKLFAGRIYAKGKADNPDCYKDDFTALRTKKPHYTLPFGMCGMKSLRSVDPRGMYYGITLVVSFHPLLITKIDQAFHVKCFFEEANRGLTAELGVSMIPTTEVEARHGIPGCTYSIHRSSIADLDAGRPAGPPIQFARVGDKVLHQWHCDDQMFGIRINNCYVTDGFGQRASVVDEKGCPVDPIVITGIRYSPDLQRAYAESQVFKFADKPGVWFFCQIQMCMKKAGMCDGITPPACASVGIHGGGASTSTANQITEESENSDEETADGNETAGPTKRIASRPPPKGKTGPTRKTTPATDEDYQSTEGDEEEEETPKHDAKATPTGYGIASTSSSDYDVPTEPVTVFGPAYPHTPEVFGPSHRKIFGNLDASEDGVRHKEQVTTEFETNDDLSTSSDGRTTPISSTAAKKDYSDYDPEATIPPNLTDLLAKLPEEIDADSLQKMFHDSVADRRALLEGFDMLLQQKKVPQTTPIPPAKTLLRRTSPRQTRRPGDRIQTMEVSWDSHRMARHVPFPKESSSRDPPMISGQLMIFDLDEEPPRLDDDPRDTAVGLSECAISRQALFTAALFVAVGASVLFVVIFILYLRLSRLGHLQKLESSVPRKTFFEAPFATAESSSRFRFVGRR